MIQTDTSPLRFSSLTLWDEIARSGPFDGVEFCGMCKGGARSRNTLDCEGSPRSTIAGSYTLYFPSVQFPKPRGFPDKISDDASTFHHVYRFADSAGSGDASYAQRLNQQLVNNPTPMVGQAATPEGTKIDVNGNNAISRFTGKDDVISYKIALPGGASAVLNVTTGDHAARWGVVYRLTQGSSTGEQSIITYGEGNSPAQYIFDHYNNQSQEIWSQSAKDIIRRAELNGN